MEANKALKLRELVAELKKAVDTQGSRSDNHLLPVSLRRNAEGQAMALHYAANRLEAILNGTD